MKFLISLKNRSAFSLNKYSSYLFAFATFAFAFYLQYSVAFLGLDLHHDLLMFDAARNFHSGQIPYKDFFYQYNLATLFLHSATLVFLGLKIVALKKITVFFYALIALLIYMSCAIEGSKRSGFLLSILWILLSPFYMPAMNGYHPWPTIYMMFSCMAGLFCLQLAIRKCPLVFSFLAGAFFCLGFWFKQVAAFQIIAVVIWLALSILSSLRDKVDYLKYIKIFAGYVLGGLLAIIPFFSYLYVESATQAWWNDAFIFNKYFSTDSQNATGLVASLKILFPIAKDMGYRSILWALCPIVLCVVTFQSFIGQRSSFQLLKSQKENIALFALAGFAGWVEYFPLPHSFHAQIFMAPTFVVIGMLLGKHPASFKEIKKHLLIFLVIYAFIVDLGYEGIIHIKGWNHKRLAYKDSVSINIDSTFDELKIDEQVEKSLVNFYQKMRDLKSFSQYGDFMPISVDPLRGLLPGKVGRPSEFKMGVDWTWPNELVEPGFHSKVNDQIALGQRPIYADSLIYIPGYLPFALLEMKAPVSSVHSLYKPQLMKSKLIMRGAENNEILYATSEDLDHKSRNIIFGSNSRRVKLNLIPFNDLSYEKIKEIKNIHIIIIEEEELPRRLSSLQMDYLDKMGKYYGGDLPGSFRLDDQGGGVLRDNLSIEDKKNLAFLMLSSGKLFQNQNHPTYASTLSRIYKDRPILVGLPRDGQYIRLLWGVQKDGVGRVNKANYKAEPMQIYLAVNPVLNQEGSKFFIVQIELVEGQALNYFYAFKND
ncbi:hypothetical protein A9235_01940 [Polynucleobacter sp. MWH-Tro8-2-5-gr]|uniref:hypothetical protein n=1 Tax=Polynucleobacter sp. MWH-Tro8-2-5-gr TaxID=1855606 RepID=UPI0008F961E2|nr:hypothetical protein [Polynucleobacter sp. MWH-Tro8-2-5-gr]OIN02471.1 hypothetical protein A9235_01940 [Polynucleobacter sp. MWH-Tro8-2-5-gr]